MKKLFTLFALLCLCTTILAQQTIALVEPRVGKGSTAVKGMEKQMVLGELRKALVKFDGYDAITRTDINQILKEQVFQRTGMVSDAQIKKIGELSGADYLCISTLTKSETEFYLEAYLIHIESGKISNPASCYGELYEGSLSNMYYACQSLANELLEGISYTPTLQPIPTEEENEIAYILQHSREMQLYKIVPSWLGTFPTTEECGMNMSLVHENVKGKAFQDAFEFWKEVYYNCPNYNKAIYTDGERILQWYIENTRSDFERKKYIDLLMETYDKRLFFFSNDERYPKAYILGKKGLSLFAYSSSIEEKMLSYFLLKNAVDGMREKCPASILATYFDASAWIFLNYPKHQSTFDADFRNVRMYLQKTAYSSSISKNALHRIENRYSLLRHVTINSEFNEDIVSQEIDRVELQEEEDVIFYVVETMPEFPGGQDSLMRYLSMNVKYPVLAQENGIQGKTTCQCTIEKDGSITDVKVVKSSGNEYLDKEAVRVLSCMPRWKPGYQRGKPVRVTYTIPINFRLQ